MDKFWTKDDNDGKSIFVFGANEAGIHGAGAAREALRHWGAIYGQGEGQQGMSYGIPTKDAHIETLPLWQIKIYVDNFLEYAACHTELTFLVSKIGCGLAGLRECDIAPMFAFAPSNCILPEGWRK